MNKNVIFFLTGLDSGGLENYLLRFLKENGFTFNNIIIYCKGGKGGVLEDEYLKLPNVRIIKKNLGTFNIIKFFKLYLWFRNYNKYTVCDFTGNFSGPILFASKIANINNRIVFYRSSSNRFPETFFRLKINSFYHKLVKKYATNILANSAYAFEFFFGKNYSDFRTKVIYNGINAKELLQETEGIQTELNIDNNTIVIGHTGRYNPAKNHGTIIKVAEVVVRKYANAIFVLCGKGVVENLQSIVKKRGLESRIILFENRNDIPKVLNTFDIYYFPSITEGQPNSLIEAWIKGIPFIASNIPPIENITPLKYKSYLVDPLDIQLNIDSIGKLIDKRWNNNERHELADFAIEEFSADKRFREFRDII
ncbi:hypothetical protein SF1_01650 [Sphingobacterium faecium NBRC 15299]|uniref:glycosyltransferase n=1 Tax=Sphingobacterium faecium TaxID=34087 RepID=UPI000D35027F|nr:glycosyltransferase [Sphingobacterium faecium]PTX12474.1 glycosyltransferase involved in cell wall biosynthesis [Sphingobacterium faecium]GEM62183.1 hypothetical protein SF1_01650 [Sphingobacterium faecium NBRC 15299]